MPAAADGQASINDFVWYEDADSEEPMHPQSKEDGPANQHNTDGATHTGMPSRPVTVASTPTKKTLAAGPKAVQHPRVAELKGKASLKPSMPRSKKELSSGPPRRSTRKRKAPSSSSPQQAKKQKAAVSESFSNSSDDALDQSSQGSDYEEEEPVIDIDCDLHSDSRSGGNFDVNQIISEAIDEPVIVSFGLKYYSRLTALLDSFTSPSS